MSSLELRNRIAQFIDNEISLQEFEEWLVPYIPELIEDPTSSDADLVAAVELVLAEYNDDIRDLDAVKEYLGQSLQEFNTVFLELSELPSRPVTSASNRTSTDRITIPASRQIIVTEMVAGW